MFNFIHSVQKYFQFCGVSVRNCVSCVSCVSCVVCHHSSDRYYRERCQHQHQQLEQRQADCEAPRTPIWRSSTPASPRAFDFGVEAWDDFCPVSQKKIQISYPHTRSRTAGPGIPGSWYAGTYFIFTAVCVTLSTCRHPAQPMSSVPIL